MSLLLCYLKISHNLFSQEMSEADEVPLNRRTRDVSGPLNSPADDTKEDSDEDDDDDNTRSEPTL